MGRDHWYFHLLFSTLWQTFEMHGAILIGAVLPASSAGGQAAAEPSTIYTGEPRNKE